MKIFESLFTKPLKPFIMKTRNLTLILAFMLLTSNAILAITPDTSKHIKIPDEIKMALTRKMDFPPEASAQNIEGKVALCFTITPQGIVKVNDINGHPTLQQGVLKELKSMHFPENMAYANKHMFIKYQFNKE